MLMFMAVTCLLITNGLSQPEDADAAADQPVFIKHLLPVKPLSRAQRPAYMEAVIRNNTETPLQLEARLVMADKIRCTSPSQSLSLPAQDWVRVTWTIESPEAGSFPFMLEVRSAKELLASCEYRMDFLPPMEQQKLPYIPDPQPVRSDILVGAHNCPLWEADRPEMWTNVLKHPERTPALGFYAQENPEVADWETKWASEHGIDFFIYCWYRTSQGGPVTMNFGSALHDAFFKSRFVNHMKFTIMWENQVRGSSGVNNLSDLMENLLPFWMEHYFKHPSYLKVDNKPVLFIYRPEFLIDDLGGEDKVEQAFDLMRQTCKAAGFDGLYILGEYRGLDPNHLQLMKRLGLDYTFAYCWGIPDNPTPQQAIETQLKFIRKTQQLGILPQVVTVSQAWSGWADEGSIWKIPPDDFRTLLREAKSILKTFPSDQLGSRMLLLDNWNEWGEGHYIAPYREYGFGYLDAVRETIAGKHDDHLDLLPEDIGMGPYDGPYQAYTRKNEELRRLVNKRITREGSTEKGLVGWWTFDEEKGAEVAYDYSGNRLGGICRDIQHSPGIIGNALLCQGGCVEVPSNATLSLDKEITITCWVKTEDGNQQNTWMVNRVLAGGTHTGYRLGVLNGKPCFEVPLTEWSHHLAADIPLPIGRWVHLAGTYDGKTMLIYVDGKPHGQMERSGPIHPNDFHLVLGNFEVKHQSYFRGLLDEVKLYDRALSADEIRNQHERVASKTP